MYHFLVSLLMLIVVGSVQMLSQSSSLALPPWTIKSTSTGVSVEYSLQEIVRYVQTHRHLALFHGITFLKDSTLQISLDVSVPKDESSSKITEKPHIGITTISKPIQMRLNWVRTANIAITKSDWIHMQGRNLGKKEILGISFKERLRNVTKFEKEDAYGITRTINPEFIAQENFLSSKVQSTRNLQSTDSDWYKPTQSYVEFRTRGDGIAVINLQDILRLEPTFNGKNYQGIQLYHRGKLCPLGVVSSDNFISSDDKLYLRSSRARGDTTWFSPFDSTEVFYISYSENNGSPLLTMNIKPLVQSQAETPVNTTLHLERDRLYFQGGVNRDILDVYITHITKTVPTEGWWWQGISYSNGFRVPFSIGTSIGDIVLRTHAVGALKDTNFRGQREHTLQRYVDDIMIDSTDHDGLYDTVMTAQKSSSQIVGGSHVLTVQTINTKGITAFERFQNIDYIDYHTIEYVGTPIPNNHIYHFTKKQTSNGAITLGGFPSSTVYILDTLRKTLTLPETKMSFLVNSGIARISSERSTSSVEINGQSILDTTNIERFVIVTNSPITIKKINPSEDEISQIINSAPNDAVVVVGSFNGITQPALISLINSSTNTNSFIATNSTLLCSFSKGQQGYSMSLGSSSASITTSPTVARSSSNMYSARYSLDSGLHDVVAVSENDIERPIVSKTNISDLRNTLNKAYSVIITNSKFELPIQKLATYRRSTGYEVAVVRVEDIYKEFGYGERSPHAIKTFLEYIYSSWSAPKVKYVTLVGDASWDMRKILPESTMENYLPTYGKPVSDSWYTQINPNTARPQLSIGRLPAQTTDELESVIDKIIAYDTSGYKSWMKTYVGVGGGSRRNPTGEAQVFYSAVSENASIQFSENSQILDRLMCVEVKSRTAFDYSSKPPSMTIGNDVVTDINQGALWVAYVGHGSPDRIDAEASGWEARFLTNKNRYPLLTTFSCQTGAFAENQITGLNESWLLARDKGMVACMGNTGFGLTDVDNNLLQHLIISFIAFNARCVGDIWQYGTDQLLRTNVVGPSMNTGMQYALLGDPMTKFHHDTTIHPYFEPNDFTLRNDAFSNTVTIEDSIAVLTLRLQNSGLYLRKPTPMRYIVTNPKTTIKDTIHTLIDFFCREVLDSIRIPLREIDGIYTVEMTFDPDTTMSFPANRTFTLQYNIFGNAILPVDPQKNWSVSTMNPIFCWYYPFHSQQIVYEAELYNQDSLIVARANSRDNRDVFFANNKIIRWKPQITLQDKQYSVRVRANNEVSNIVSPWLEISGSTTATFDSLITHDENLLSPTLPITVTNLQTNSDTTISSTLGYSLNHTMSIDAFGVYGTGYTDSTGRYIVTIESGFGLSVDDVRYLNIPRPSDLRGFNVLVIPRNTNQPRIVQSFDVFGVFENSELKPYDEQPVKVFYDFLKNTVKNNEYVIMVTSQVYHIPRGFDNVRNRYRDMIIDSLTSVMRYLNVSTPDSLLPPNSFAYVGLKTDTGFVSIADKFVFGDTSRITVTVPYILTNGSIETTLFGPAKEWKTFSYSGLLDTTNTQTQTIILGKSPNSGFDTLLVSTNNSTINLDSLNNRGYSYIKAKIVSDANNFDKQSIYSQYSLVYSPVSEAYVAAVQTPLTTPTRGDTVTVSVEIQVASYRSHIDSLRLLVQGLGSSGGNITIIDTIVTDFRANEKKRVDIPVATLSLFNETMLVAKILPLRLDDLYPNNNIERSTFSIGSDSVAPKIRLFVDNIEVDTVSQTHYKPTLTVLLDDNARIGLSDSRTMFVRHNATVLTSSLDSTFKRYPTDSLWLLPMSMVQNQSRYGIVTSPLLETGQNNIIITAVDGFNNRSVKTYKLFVPDVVSLGNVLVYPNPSSQDVTLSYTLQSNNFVEPVRLEIYSVLGDKIITLNANPQSGGVQTAKFVWNGVADDGNSVPSGVYYYRLYTQVAGVEDNKNGIIVRVR